MEQINLNIIPDGVMPVCHASQFDKSRTIRFNLKDNGSVYTLAGTETITCKVRKPDDTENTINVANTSSSYVDVTFGLGDTDLSGYAMCELKIVKGTQTIGSRNFLLNIEADAFDGSKFEERSASGAIASFETNYIDNLNELIVDITATQAGSGTPSNPCSISGWSECNIHKSGINLWDEEWELGTYDANGETVSSNDRIRSKNYIPCLGNTEYYYKGERYGYFYFYDNNKTYISNAAKAGNSIFTTPTNAKFIRFRLEPTYGTTYNHDISINYPSTDTSYHAFNGGTDTISLGDTYYGGTLNVTTGEMTVTHGIKTFDGTLSYTMTGDGKIVYCDATPDAKVIQSNYGQASAICDYFRNEPNSVAIRQGEVDMSFNIGSAYFSNTPRTVFRNSNWTSVSDAINFFSDNPTQIVYELATPTTVQLTPTEVRTLLTNNIFADTGDVVSCKYLVEVT